MLDQQGIELHVGSTLSKTPNASSYFSDFYSRKYFPSSNE